MPDFRYAQFCPMARSAELLGERWTLLVIRELFTGPQRFSDLRRRLPGVSSSVLSERLAKLEEKGVVQRRNLGPPAASTVYDLDEAGRALEPVLVQLSRWGIRFLDELQPGDHIEPSWMRLGLSHFAARRPGPVRRYAIRIADPSAAEGEIHATVESGPDGTKVRNVLEPADVTLRTDALTMMALASGGASAEQLIAAGALQVEGDPTSLADFPALFEIRERDPQPNAIEESGD